jgi:hypothetical protein
MFYQTLIKELLRGRDYDPRHIESFMRIQYGTLNHLTREDFEREVKVCMACIDACGKDDAEQYAKSMGL